MESFGQVQVFAEIVSVSLHTNNLGKHVNSYLHLPPPAIAEYLGRTVVQPIEKKEKQKRIDPPQSPYGREKCLLRKVQYNKKIKPVYEKMSASIRPKLAEISAKTFFSKHRENSWRAIKIHCKRRGNTDKNSTSLCNHTIPLPREGWDARSNFKLGLTGLTNEFFFLLDELLRQDYRDQSGLLLTK